MVVIRNRDASSKPSDFSVHQGPFQAQDAHGAGPHKLVENCKVSQPEDKEAGANKDSIVRENITPKRKIVIEPSNAGSRGAPVQSCNEGDQPGEPAREENLEELKPKSQEAGDIPNSNGGENASKQKKETVDPSKAVSRGVKSYQKGDYQNAVKEFQLALEAQISSEQEDRLAIAQIVSNLGAAFLKQGRLLLAAEALEEAAEIKGFLLNNESGNESVLMADTLNNLGNLAYVRGDFKLSLDLYRLALRDIEQNNGPAVELANALHNIGRLHIVREEWEAATSLLTRCLRVETKLFGEDSLQRADTLELMGYAFVSLKYYDNAMIYFSDVLSIYQKKYGLVNEHVATALVNVAMVLEERGKKAEAWNAYSTAKEVLQQVGVSPEHRSLITTTRGMEATLGPWSEQDFSTEASSSGDTADNEDAREDHVESSRARHESRDQNNEDKAITE